MKIKSKKNIKKNRKHSRKNVRKNKRSKKNVGKYFKKNVMKGGVWPFTRKSSGQPNPNPNPNFKDSIKHRIKQGLGLTGLTGLAGLRRVQFPFKRSSKNINPKSNSLIIEELILSSKNFTPLKKCQKKDKLYKIKFKENSQLKSIGQAFYDCFSLHSITIPASVESIGEGAFSQCKQLETVTFEKGSQLKSIGNNAFVNCISLKTITIPISVTIIGDYAFSKCKNLKIVTFEEGSKLESIGDYAFKDCKNLTYININQERKINVSINFNLVFENCPNITVELIQRLFNEVIVEPKRTREELIIFEPELETLTYNPTNSKNNSIETIEAQDIKEAISFIDTILKKDKIKNNSLNNKGQTELISEYKTFLSKDEDNSNFNKLVANNYKNGKKALQEIDTSNKYMIDLHGVHGVRDSKANENKSVTYNIFKLPDNINIIFLSPVSYNTCIYTAKLNVEDINQYIQNPYCVKHPYYKEAILYLGGQYCIDLNLSRRDKDYATGIRYINTDKIEEAYIYNNGDHSFTLSDFLKTGKDHTQAMLNKDNQYTFIVIACRGSFYTEMAMSKIVFYELSIKILNFFLHYKNNDKRKQMNNRNNVSIDNKYNKCKKKIFKERNPVNDRGLGYQQTNMSKGPFKSRHGRAGNTTVVKHSFGSISVDELKSKVNSINDTNKNITFQELSDILELSNDFWVTQRSHEKPIYVHDKEKFDIIKQIFKDNYDLMFEFIVYIDNKTGIINYEYLFKGIDGKTLDIKKITYRINI